MSGFKQLLTTIDTHTVGQPTRTVIGGLPPLKGINMSEKMLYMKKHYDYLRTFLIAEPRGSRVTSAAVIIEPTLPEADIGAFFFESHGYMPMCGHSTIGVSTMLVESGLVKVKEPVTEIKIETPAGLIDVSVVVQNGKAINVTFKNAPAFTLCIDKTVQYEGKEVVFDIAYGGNFYAIVYASSLNLELVPDNLTEIVSKALDLKNIINKNHKICHPEKKYLDTLKFIQFVDPVTKIDNAIQSKNVVVYSPGEVDRSPCGTGTSARMSNLFYRGLMKPGDTFINESIIGSIFQGKIDSVIEDYYGHKAIVPLITGSAYITGYHTFVLDPLDPKGYGFDMGRY